MLGAGSLFLIFVSLFVLSAFITRKEVSKGERLFLGRTRDLLDRILDSLHERITLQVRFVVRHTIKLSWYYSIHSALRAVLTLLVKSYDRLELVFMQNRERARLLRAEKKAHARDNHLTAIGEHKVATALTPSQKKKLRAKKLIGE